MTFNRPPGRAVFYSRDSGGEHEMTPGQYVLWASAEAAKLKLTFDGTPFGIEQLIHSDQPRLGDLFFDNRIAGNLLSRRGLDALKAELARDRTISHVFIPRRERLARPDDAIEGVLLERSLREAGITLVFMNKSLPPLQRGQQQDIGEALSAYIEYYQSGKFREDLAEKMIHAQLALAKLGYSTGGRPPYGFRRHLIRIDGTVIRPLEEGELVRQRGHHVVWLPGPDNELDLIQRILALLVIRPAGQVVRMLNAEGIPSPDTGRYRTDGGVSHPVSGLWNYSTIVGIARNPLLRAMTNYGRRSMGDRRRMTPDGPRPINESDFRPDSKPKVIQNPISQQIVGKAHGPRLISEEASEQLLGILDKRGGSQRGKPRSRNPAQNPLGARVFDMNCGWPMYREAYSKNFRYACGFYHQSDGQQCEHNWVNGPAATRFALAAIGQRLLNPDTRRQIEERLRAKARQGTQAVNSSGSILATKQAELAKITADLKTAVGNLARARAETFAVIEQVVVELQDQKRDLESQIQALTAAPTSVRSAEAMIQAAMAMMDQLPKLADDPTNFGRLGELFNSINLQLFLRFEPTRVKKRTLNRITGGILTTGNAPEPIKKYTGPTGRRATRKQLVADSDTENLNGTSRKHPNSEQGAESLRNVSRGDKTAIELFLRVIRGWDTGLRRQMNDGKPC